MNIESFLIMRHELMLTLAAVLMLIAELSFGKSEKSRIIPLAIFIFGAVTAVGFLPAPTGSLFGGMYQTSALIILMKNILNLGVFIVCLQSASWLKLPVNQDKGSEYFLLMISTLIGMNFMISAGDFLMFYLGLELATIPLTALAAYETYKMKSAESGIKLILSASLSSGITLFGISMIYGTTGSIYFNEVAPLITGDNLQVLGFLFFFTGLAFKISIVPFHLWTADVYEGAPVNITSYLSVVSKAAALFILIILMFTVFNALEVVATKVVYVTAILTMTVGNLFAIRQQNLKRFLAFSSIAQAGFIFLGVIGGPGLGITSVIYFILIYVFSNLGAFGVIAVISGKTGKENIPDYNGLYLTNPKLSLVMMLSLFSLAGIPPVAGFFGKFFLFAAAAQQGYYILVLIAVANAVISLYYYLLVVKAMFINKSEQPIEPIHSDGFARVGMVLCVLGMVVIGFASIIFDYIETLSRQL